MIVNKKLDKAIYFREKYGNPIIGTIAFLVLAIGVWFFNISFTLRLVLSIIFIIAIPLSLLLYFKLWYPYWYRGAKQKLRESAQSKVEETMEVK